MFQKGARTGPRATIAPRFASRCALFVKGGIAENAGLSLQSVPRNQEVLRPTHLPSAFMPGNCKYFQSGTISYIQDGHCAGIGKCGSVSLTCGSEGCLSGYQALTASPGGLLGYTNHRTSGMPCDFGQLGPTRTAPSTPKSRPGYSRIPCSTSSRTRNCCARFRCVP
jgi:hypothetical protein